MLLLKIKLVSIYLKDSILVFKTRRYKVKKIRRTADANVVVAVLHASGKWEVSEANKYSVIAAKSHLMIKYTNRTQLSADQKRWMNFDYSAYKQSAQRNYQAEQTYQREQYAPQYQTAPQQRDYRYSNDNRYQARPAQQPARQVYQPQTNYTNVNHGSQQYAPVQNVRAPAEVNTVQPKESLYRQMFKEDLTGLKKKT